LAQQDLKEKLVMLVQQDRRERLGQQAQKALQVRMALMV
jgi:hypothetical protein